MEKPTSFFDRAAEWVRTSVTLRLVTIGILILVLLIPMSFIKELIYERQYRQEEAIREVSSKWGESQIVNGLVLTVPYLNYQKVEKENGASEIVETRSYCHFLPEILNFQGNITPEIRYRGIYEVVVYNAQLQVSGKFKQPDFSDWKIEDKNILWEEAFVSVGLSDLRSIQQDVKVIWNGQSIGFNPGVETSDVIGTGISARVSGLQQDTVLNFNVKLDFNGSSNLQFTPLGKKTTVALESSWATPSFSGAFLPDERKVETTGFSANWQVLHLNRPYPQRFKNSVTGISESVFGVDLLLPIDEYQKSTRSVKYATMFVLLTFMVFFFVQILHRIKIHPIQYLLVGLALCVFYTLLIALSEHIAFRWSYLISSLSTIGLITFYVHNIFKQPRLTQLMALILVLLYLFIFTILQLEDYSLLMGSIGLFIVLAIAMFLSRKIDWYNV